MKCPVCNRETRAFVDGFVCAQCWDNAHPLREKYIIHPQSRPGVIISVMCPKCMAPVVGFHIAPGVHQHLNPNTREWETYA